MTSAMDKQNRRAARILAKFARAVNEAIARCADMAPIADKAQAEVAQ